MQPDHFPALPSTRDRVKRTHATQITRPDDAGTGILAAAASDLQMAAHLWRDSEQLSGARYALRAGK